MIAFLCRISGYSRQQTTRLIKRYCTQGKLIWSVAPAKRFVSHYSAEDIRHLAEIDALHDTPSRPARRSKSSGSVPGNASGIRTRHKHLPIVTSPFMLSETRLSRKKRPLERKRQNSQFQASAFGSFCKIQNLINTVVSFCIE
jgi:hypothetical protein